MIVKLSEGAEHKLPNDLKKALSFNHEVCGHWENLTPLARTEFIAWVEDAKKDDTRQKRITRTCEDLMSGKKRPCCWPGYKNKDKYKKK